MTFPVFACASLRSGVGVGWSFFKGGGVQFWYLQKDFLYVLIACCYAHLGLRADQLRPTFN